MRSLIVLVLIFQCFKSQAALNLPPVSDVCGKASQTLLAAAKEIDDPNVSSERKSCLVESFIHTTISLHEKQTVKAYVSVVRWLRDTDLVSSSTAARLLNGLQELWVKKYFVEIGNQSIIRDRLSEAGDQLRWGGAIATSGTLLYLARRYKQETSLLKVAISGLSKRSAIPMLALIMTPFGNKEGLSEVLADAGKSELTHFLSRPPESIPPSPAFVFLNADDTEEFDLSYDEYLLLRDTTAIAGATVAAATYAFSKVGNRSDAFIRLFLIQKSKQLALQPTAALRTADWFRRSRKVTRFTPPALASLVAELTIYQLWGAWKEHRQTNRLLEARRDFLEAVLRLREGDSSTLAPQFMVELYLNALVEFNRFILEPYMTSLDRQVAHYHESRFCSSYRFLERRLLPPPTSLRPGIGSSFRNRYKVWVNPEKEFKEVTDLSRERFINSTKAIHTEHAQAIEMVKTAIQQFRKDLSLLVSLPDADSKPNIWVQTQLQTRLSLIEKISLVESEERMQQEVFARSERLIGFQFDLESGQKRICPSMEREFAFSQPEDIWQCYKEIAEEIGCAPYLGLTL